MRSTVAGVLAAVVALHALAARVTASTPEEELLYAIERGNIAAVKAFVEGGGSPDAPLPFAGYTITPLMRASAAGRLEVIRYLLSKGAAVNARGSEGDTALIQAGAEGRDDAVEVLLKAGADAKAHNKKGYTAFGLAALGGHLEAADLLAAAGADANTVDTSGITPLMTATSICNPETIRYLVGKGAQLDRITQLEYGGSTALTTAALLGQADCARTLLELGADPAVKMKNGATALSIAQENHHQDVADLIKAALAKGPRKPAPPKPAPKPAPPKP